MTFGYTFEEVLDHPTDWIALAYEQAITIETKQYGFWVELIGAIFGGNKKKNIQSGKIPNSAELMAVGIKRK